MKYAILYFSRYGNGKKIVDHLSNILKKDGADTQVLTINEANPTAMPKADMYIFSAPAEAFSLQRDMKTFMKNLSGLDGKKYGIINTHGMKKSRLSVMEKLLSKQKMVKTAEVDFQVSKDAQSGNGLPNGWETKVNEFAKKI
jgi:flavodoxin